MDVLIYYIITITIDEWAAGRGRRGGGAGVHIVKSGIERNGPLDGRTLGPIVT